MKAITALTNRRATRSVPTSSAPADTIDRALTLLATGGFEFEPVDRCPTRCRFCDGPTVRAA